MEIWNILKMANKNKCPECNSNEICKIPSSTLLINKHNEHLFPESILKNHYSIRNICTDCLCEW